MHLKDFEIPQGLYAGAPLVPPRPVTTIATTAFLAVREDVSEGLVNDALRSLYEEDLPLKFSALIERNKVLDWTPVPLHPVARSYFDPDAAKPGSRKRSLMAPR